MKAKKQAQASKNVSRRANLEKLKQGYAVWNAWCDALRSVDPDWRADLRDANLAGLRLSGLDLRRAVLSGADLRNAALHDCDLRAAKFRGANLAGAALSHGTLRRANFAQANLQETSFNWSRLEGARFCQAQMQGCSLLNSRIGNSYFLDLDLSGVEGLETVAHYAPSHLSIATLVQTADRLPRAFLQGCGLSPATHAMLAGKGVQKQQAFDALVDGHPKRRPRAAPSSSPLPVAPARRYVVHWCHGWRARLIQTHLNENTDQSWLLINLWSSPERLLEAIPESASKPCPPLVVLVNTWRARGSRFEAAFRPLRKKKLHKRARLIWVDFGRAEGEFDGLEYRYVDARSHRQHIGEKALRRLLKAVS